MDTKTSDSEVLPLDRYIRAVAVCNSLALLASQGTMTQFLQRLAILTQLQKYWTKGYDSVAVTCSAAANDDDEDDNKGDDDNVEDNSPCRNDSLAVNSDVAFGSLEQTDDWETHSNSTVDLKPDVDAVELPEPEPQPTTKSSARGNGKRRKTSSKASREEYTCSHCGETFKYRSAVVRHENQKHPQLKNEQTSVEPEPLVSTKDIDVKLENTTQNDTVKKSTTRSRYHYQNRFPCSTCGKLFKFRSALKYHDRIHGRVDQRSVARHHTCTVCSATFQYPSLLKIHMKKHVPKDAESTPANRREQCTDNEGRPPPPDSSTSKKFSCIHCDRWFGSQATLDAHLRTHTGERPYQCRIDGCTKRFAQTSTRSYHERTHSNSAPHICADCGRGFKHAPNLARHARVHTGLRPYPCYECDMAFKTLGRLKDHTRRHTGELPYICSQCPSKFRCTSQLRRHENSLHSRNKLWHCSVCGKVFTQPGNLRTHMRTHTGEKPYACNLCDMRFSHSGSLKGHVKTHAYVQNGKF